MFRHLPEGLREGARFRVYPIFFNVGINAEVALSQLTGSDHLEREINADGLRDLGYTSLPFYSEPVSGRWRCDRVVPGEPGADG